jgi:hypothetical protein
MKLLLAAFITLTTSSAALAGVDPYIALGAEIGQYETENPSNQYPDLFEAAKYTDVAINGRLGLDVGPYFSAEFEAAFNLGAAAEYSAMNDDGIGGFEGENDVKSRLFFFLRGGAPISDQVKLFARAGIGATKRVQTYRSYGIYQFNGTPYDETRTYEETAPAAALGIGIEYALKPESKSTIRADFTRYSSYIGGEDQDIDYVRDTVFSIAYVHKF